MEIEVNSSHEGELKQVFNLSQECIPNHRVGQEDTSLARKAVFAEVFFIQMLHLGQKRFVGIYAVGG